MSENILYDRFMKKVVSCCKRFNRQPDRIESSANVSVPLVDVVEMERQVDMLLKAIKNRNQILPFRSRINIDIDKDVIACALADGLTEFYNIDMKYSYGYDMIREWIRLEFRLKKNDRVVLSFVKKMGKQELTNKFRQGGKWYWFIEWLISNMMKV